MPISSTFFRISILPDFVVCDRRAENRCRTLVRTKADICKKAHEWLLDSERVSGDRHPRFANRFAVIACGTIARRTAPFHGGLIRKTAMSLAIALFGLASGIHLHAASLAGVTRPDTAQIGSTTLLLNGLGLRTRYMVKVYVAGLYFHRNRRTPLRSSMRTRLSGSSCTSCTVRARSR
jgi:hypothetical protein